jgi:dethiobiotin synthetase
VKTTGSPIVFNAVKRVFFITGTDTGVGKTVLTVLLTRHLGAGGTPMMAVKPFCSGGREDAEALLNAQSGGKDSTTRLDALNPWHFRAPLTPLLAARRERRRVEKGEAVRFLKAAAAGAGVLLIEGAGGLLSPLGEGFSARDLISALGAFPLVVCPNRLGAINQALLVLHAMPAGTGRRARIVLMEPREPDGASRTNPGLLRELVGPDRVFQLPWFQPEIPHHPKIAVRRILDQLLA